MFLGWFDVNCACPHCAGQFENRPDIAGKWIGCPHCGQQFQLPALAVAKAVAKAIPVAMPAHAALPVPMAVAVARPATPPPPPVAPPLPTSAPFVTQQTANSRVNAREPSRKKAIDPTALVLIVGAVIAVPAIGIGAVFAWQQSRPPVVKQANRSVEKNANSKPPAIAELENKSSGKSSSDSRKNDQPRSVPTLSPDDEERRLPNGKVSYIASATQAKYDRIRAGMTKEELFSFMGEPPALKTEYEPDGKVEHYMWGSRSRYGVVFVITKDGKVLSKKFTGKL